MNFKSKLSMVAAAAALSTSGAQAVLLETFPSNNSSLVFLALDTTGTPTSLVVDLNFNLNDFDPTLNAPLVGMGQTVVWDFKHDTLTVNGVVQAGNFAWSEEFAQFDAAAQAAETKFGVIAGSQSSGKAFLTTGNPTAANLTAQTSTNTTSMNLTNGLLNNNNGKGTLTSDGTITAGAHSIVEGQDGEELTAAFGYIPSNQNLGTNLNWQGKLSWQAMVAEGTSSVFYRLRSGSSTEIQVGGPFFGAYGTFNYNDGALTWATPVPETGTLAMLMAGLGAMSLVIRRRNSVR